MAHPVAASDSVQITGTERQTVHSRRRVPQYFEYRPAPLPVGTEQLPPVVASLRPLRVEIVRYDFGAAAVNYSSS